MLSRQRKTVEHFLRSDQHVLAAVELVSDRRTFRRAASVGVPQRCAGCVVERENIAVIIGCEYQAAGGAQDTGPILTRTEIVLPANLAGLVFNGLQRRIGPDEQIASGETLRLAFRQVVVQAVRRL